MQILTLDFETYFDADYTLKKLTTEAYIRDERFEAHGVGLLWPDGQKFFTQGPAHTRQMLASIDWSRTAVLAQHAHFDGLILSHVFGHSPAFWLDTLSMARMMLGNHVSASLESLARHFDLSAKTVPYDKIMGRRWDEMDDALKVELGAGCLHDCALTKEIFTRFMQAGFPKEELKVIDLTVRMFTQPVLVGDQKHFEWIKDKEWTTKNEMLLDLGVSDKDLGSNAKFIALLEEQGIEVEYKEGKNGPIPAFAKTDDFMKGLLNDVNQRVSDLAEAKLSIRSTIDETRAGRFASMASRGALPVYLQYCGADTLRWSGGDSVNYQNFGRKSELRRGLKAPKGFKLAVYDKSQIECRFLNRIAEQWDVIERFEKGEDPYIPLASKIYGREITKEDKAERGTGKQGELMCGYGAGALRFQATAKHGLYGPSVDMSLEEATRAVDIYRDTHPGVLRFWKEGNWVLRQLSDKTDCGIWRECFHVKNGRIYLPNGAFMNYTLRWEPEGGRNGKGGWLRKTRNGWKSIWGGVIVQNCMEAIARVDLSQGMLRLAKLGIRAIGTVHDELWFLHPDSEAEARHKVCIEELSRSPTWLDRMPVAVEGHMGEVYEK